MNHLMNFVVVKKIKAIVYGNDELSKLGSMAYESL